MVLIKRKTAFGAILLAVLGIISCGKKSIPTASPVENNVSKIPVNTAPPVAVRKDTTPTAVAAPNVKPKLDSVVAETKTTAYNKVFVAVDSKGILHVPNEELPGTFGTDSLKALRAFSPYQVKNLAARFSTIPPRVLYVPDNLSKKGMRGIYYIYNRKFWYWRKSDGFFYLDTNYYN